MRSDSSGKNRNERSDLLWADWGIHHLHVAEKQTDNAAYFSARADYLLFVMFGRDVALFVDVHPTLNYVSAMKLEKNWFVA